MGAERWDEQVGSVADEAGRLLESLRRSAAEAAERAPQGEDGPDAAAPGSASGSPGSASAGMPGTGAAAGPDGATHDPFCTWCPLCRGAAVIRSLSPETLARLADLASLAATVLTDLAASRPTGPPASTDDPDAAAPARGDEPSRGAAPRRPTARPRRATTAPSRAIPVTDADDPQEESRD